MRREGGGEIDRQTDLTYILSLTYIIMRDE